MSAGTGPDAAAPADGAAEAPSRAARLVRLQALAGRTVHGSDGKTVGRVRDIYPLDARGDLAALTVMPRQLSARSVLIPAAALAEPPEVAEARGAEEPLTLVVDAATAKAGARPPLTLHATPEDLARAAEALGLDAPGLDAPAPEDPGPQR